MSLVLITIIGSLVIPAILASIAYFQWRENHADRGNVKRNAAIKAVVDNETRLLNATIQDHTTRLGQLVDHLGRIENLIKDVSTSQRESSDKISKMEVKVDMYWTSLEQLAMNSAKNLHQPDPRRAHVDHLLEAFMEGTLTPAERIELRKVLVQIRNVEPNSPPLDFPVYPGEQAAAAILLSTMDIVDPTRMAALGHSTHRNHGTAESTTTATTTTTTTTNREN